MKGATSVSVNAQALASPAMGRAYSADGKSRIRWWEDQIPPMRRPKSANGKRWSCVIIRCKVPIKCKFKEPMIQNHLPGVYPVPTGYYPFVDKYFLYLSQMKLNMSSQVYVSLFKVRLGRGAPYGDFLISNTSRCAVYSLLSWSFPCPKELLFSCTHLESDMTRRAKGPKCGRRQGGKAPDKKKFPLLG